MKPVQKMMRECQECRYKWGSEQTSSLVTERCTTGSLAVAFTGWWVLFAQDTKQNPVSWAVLGNLCWAKCSARTFPLMFHLGLHSTPCWKTHRVNQWWRPVCVEAEATSIDLFFLIVLVPYSCLRLHISAVWTLLSVKQKKVVLFCFFLLKFIG